MLVTLAERLALYQALDAGVSWATLARHGYPDWASPHHNRRDIERGYKSWREAGSPTDVSEWLAMMWV